MILGRRAISLVMVGVTLPLVASGCTGKPTKQSARPAPSPPTLSVSPAQDAKDVPISAEIAGTVGGGKIAEVVLTDDRGNPVSGAMRTDGSSWIPDRALTPKHSYTVKVTARNDSGQSVTHTSRFTTMARPANTTTSSLYFDNGRTYGVAMPVALTFEPAVPQSARADVQRRLFVQSDPPQPGAWRWSKDGRQVEYRPPDFWRPGTTITVRSALAGLPLGSGRYGDTDRVATAKVGKRVFLNIDNRSKQMSVFQDDRLLRKIPVSLGKSSTPTSSGKMVIMEKFDSTVFDTRGEPDGGYVVTVADAQRLTWGGEFIHAAPWSVGDQGNTNVSHGCTNVSAEAAAWLMRVTQVGDLVTITGTEVRLQEGNGWTAWNMNWDEFIKGSALPVPADLRPSPTAGPSGAAPGGSATSPPPMSQPSPRPSGAGG